MKKVILPFLLFTLSYSLSYCQLKQGQFAIGGDSTDYGYSLVQTKDGGYAITGYTYSYGAGAADVYAVKLDSVGNLQWTKTIGGAGVDEGESIVQTKDGGYAITGYTYSYGAGTADVYVVKLDSSGNLKWTKTIGGTGIDEGESIVQTKDGGYAITGFTYSYGAGSSDVYVVKLDSSGNLKWTKTIGGDNNDIGASIVQTTDGGYAITGYTASYGAGNYDVYIVKIDSSGNLKWTKTIGGVLDDEGFSIVQTRDGGYAITGISNSFASGNYYVYAVKLDSSGNLKWANTIGSAGDDEGESIVQTIDGGYAITGYTTSFGAGDYNVYVVKLDSSGNLKWTKIIDGAGTSEGNSIIQTKDSGYVISGFTNVYGAGNYDVYLVKIDSSGNACEMESSSGTENSGGTVSSGGTINSGGTVNSGGAISSGGIYTNVCHVVAAVNNVQPATREAEIYPNPNNGRFQLTMNNEQLTINNTIEIYNMLGEKVYSNYQIIKSSNYQIDLSGQAPGIYLYRIVSETGNGVASGKFVIK